MNIRFVFRNNNLFFIRSVRHENEPGFCSFRGDIIYCFLYTGIVSFSVRTDHRIKYACFRLRTFSDCKLNTDTFEYISLKVYDCTFGEAELTGLIIVQSSISVRRCFTFESQLHFLAIKIRLPFSRFHILVKSKQNRIVFFGRFTICRSYRHQRRGFMVGNKKVIATFLATCCQQS